MMLNHSESWKIGSGSLLWSLRPKDVNSQRVGLPFTIKICTMVFKNLELARAVRVHTYPKRYVLDGYEDAVPTPCQDV